MSMSDVYKKSVVIVKLRLPLVRTHLQEGYDLVCNDIDPHDGDDKSDGRQERLISWGSIWLRRAQE